MSANGSPVARVNMVKRKSGLLVPGNVSAEVPDTPKLTLKKSPAPPVAFDNDGRRRIVMLREVETLVEAAGSAFGPRGLMFTVWCNPKMKWDPEIEPCGEPMMMEDRGGPDEGIGCKCTRVHFIGTKRSTTQSRIKKALKAVENEL